MAAAACFGPSPLPGEKKSGRLLRGLQSAASSLLRAAPTNGWNRSHACANIVVRTPPTRGVRTGIALWLRTATLRGRCFSGDRNGNREARVLLFCRSLRADAQGSVTLTNREPGLAEMPMRNTHARLIAKLICTCCVREAKRAAS